MKRAILLVLVAVVLAWWLWPEAEATVAAPPAEPAPEAVTEEVSADNALDWLDDDDGPDGGPLKVRGVVFSDQFLEEDGLGDGEEEEDKEEEDNDDEDSDDDSPVWGRKFISGAVVRAFASPPELTRLKCGVCGKPAVQCLDAYTVKAVVGKIRSGTLRPPELLAETRADAKGRFSFDSLPRNALLVATGEEGTSQPVRVRRELELELDGPAFFAAARWHSEHEELPNPRFQIFNPLDGSLSRHDTFEMEEHDDGTQTLRDDLTLTSEDPWAYVWAEADGALPARVNHEDLRVTIGTPRTLVVKALLGGTLTEAEVQVEANEHTHTVHATGGVGRVTGLGYARWKVSVQKGDLRGEKYVFPDEPVTEVLLELRGRSKLVVLLQSPEGGPVERVRASLRAPWFNERNLVVEQGAPVVFEDLDEGVYDLSLYAGELAHVSRRVEVYGDETTLDLTLQHKAQLRGRVIDERGEPLAGVHVAATGHFYDTSDADGGFLLEADQPGEYRLTAGSNELRSEPVLAQVPGPPVTITLAPRGAVEVHVVAPPAQKVDLEYRRPGRNAHFTLRRFDREAFSEASAFFVRNVATGEKRDLYMQYGARFARVAGLRPGMYELFSETLQQHEPVSQMVEVIDGETTKVSLDFSRRLSVSGKVVDEHGAPAKRASVRASGWSYVETNLRGEFVLNELPDDEVALSASLSDGRESDTVKLRPPARDVTLKLKVPGRMRGRVVDEDGRPVRQFVLNDDTVRHPEGLFDVKYSHGYLKVTAEGYEPVEQRNLPANVGTLTLKRPRLIEGDVVDAEGRPANGAMVRLTDGKSRTVTDGQGGFRLEVPASGQWDVVALRGGLSTRVAADYGRRMRLVLSNGTRVRGLVLSASGEGISTPVQLRARDFDHLVELRSGADGRFEVTLPPGGWTASLPGTGEKKEFEVAGEELSLSLGGGKTQP